MLGHGLSGGPIIVSFTVYTFIFRKTLLELFYSRPLMVQLHCSTAQGYPYMILSVFAKFVSLL